MRQAGDRIWGLVDGSLSVSGSMLLAVLINNCHSCADIRVIGPFLEVLKDLSDKNAGVIVLGTLLLFPTTLTFYGGLKMWFAAKEAVEKKAMEKGRQVGLQEGRAEGLQEGRKEERKRIGQAVAALKQRGEPITPEEISRILEDDSTPRS